MHRYSLGITLQYHQMERLSLTLVGAGVAAQCASAPSTGMIQIPLIADVKVTQCLHRMGRLCCL
jgi:hypothetical protein